MSNRYNILSAGFEYKFTTTAGDVYTAYFTEYTLITYDHSELVVPMFGFHRQSAPRKERQGIEKDEKVKCTIQFILTEFFRLNPDNGVIYICANDDGKQLGRHLTFSKWVEEMGPAYIKYDSPEVYAKDNFHSSLIVLEANAEKEKFVNAFYYSIGYWMGNN